MIKLAVVFFSGSGHNRKMAEAVHAGADSVEGIDAELMEIVGDDISEGRWNNDDIMSKLDGSDALIFGTPTYMGCVAGQFKAFMDATSGRFFERKWADKLASAFTVSGGPSGDKLNTLQTLATFAMQHGMIWVGQNELPFNEKGINRLSFYFGVGGQALQEDPDVKPSDEDKESGRRLGVRVAETAKRFA